MTTPRLERIVAADPLGQPNARLVLAAIRAGYPGILDLDETVEATARLEDFERRSPGSCWVRLNALRATDGNLSGLLRELVDAVVLPGHLDPATLAELTAVVTEMGKLAIVSVVSVDEAHQAIGAGATGLIASGSEAGGRVGDTEAFILFQHCVTLGVPVWVRGGIGRHTAAAAIAGGAAGVIVDAALALTPESSLATETRLAVAAMDGSETRVIAGRRFYTRPDLHAATIDDDLDAELIDAMFGTRLRRDLIAIGQDASGASDLTRDHGTVGGILQAFDLAIDEHLATARRIQPLAPGHGVAAAHGTRYPIAQGPMTRVSDRAEFAEAVAEGGGLPFLALALMGGADVRTLLEATAELLGDRPWGVGVLGFVPPEIRAAQLEVVHDIRPPFALIAGGRPSQAQPLEEVGISTYLHVPSPGLLDRFLAEGARKFVFEGRECGGHVGPRSSFSLWDTQISRLNALDDADNLQLLFAGGIHDERSAAMVATAAAPLAERGARIGVLMGTAYLFTAEAVASGAIQPAFQESSIACGRTVLLETSPGHATRCVETAYVEAFRNRSAELTAAGLDAKARWAELETLNLGRLRIASKGLRREGDQLVSVDDATQRAEGMYMIGEVATLQREVTSIAALHARVTTGATEFLASARVAALVSVNEPTRAPDPLDIAIVGMDSFFPGSVGADAFWSEIVAGTDAITEVPAERWDTDLYYDEGSFTVGAGRKTPSKWGGFLDRIGFDPLAYGIPPASLAAIEPVQLLSLEVAARALRDAGYGTRQFDRSRASVIFGAESGNELGGAYGARAFLPQLFGEVPAELESHLPALTEDSFPGVLTNVIAGRIANRLDLGGVNYTIDAACASSLAAVDAACKELRSGISDLVVCGGADLHNGLNDYLMFASVHALSPTGKCRTFDGSADGIALGEGIACVVLKRRVDAERDGDRIYAVIDAVAGSSDGRSLGLTAPRKEGQQRAVERAWQQAGTDGTAYGLMEAHGTGTVVGDRTELATLTELFADHNVEPGAAVLGSVKSQIGHTKCAAGLAGLIKAAKAVYHGVLPPTCNITNPNDYYDPKSSPFRFLDRALPWPETDRHAGVSAFGFGGTNFHVAISSHDGGAADQGLDCWPVELFLIRGLDVDAAQARLATLSTTVEELAEADPGLQRHRLRDLACTISSTGNGPVQLAIVAGDVTTLADALRLAEVGTTNASQGLFFRDGERAAGSVAFLYPGQGSQRPAMTADLFVAFPWLHDLLVTGRSWMAPLLPPAAFSPEDRAAQVKAITATEVAQPTLGIASLAITRVLNRLGIVPDVAGGHSYGELVALRVAGVFDDATLLSLSQARGDAIVTAIAKGAGDPGTMAAIALSIDEVIRKLEKWDDLVVANHNGPTQTVISGPTASVEAAVADLADEGVRAKILPVACAFHSPVVAMAGNLLADHLGGVAMGRPQLPVWSNVTAEPYPEAASKSEITALLTDQVTSGVRFVDQIDSMYAAGVRTFIEAGPGRVLTHQVGKILGERPHTVVACDVSGEHGVSRMLLAVAELATLGVDVDVSALFAGRARTVDLSTWLTAAPGWTLDGAFVRRADGSSLPNSLQPANTMPPLRSHASAAASTGGAADQVVMEYLTNVRRLVAAERDVMLGYLGAAPAPAIDITHSPSTAPITTTASALELTGATAAPVTPAAVLSGDALLAEVLRIVSDRTGYPTDMLDPEADLEADLSIDSIKRIEIIGELAEQVGLPGMDGNVDESLVEELAQIKTLRGIVSWIDDLAASIPAVTISAPPAATESATIPRGDALLAEVLRIVSDRTGYPTDMLDPEADLEADLSIDSIKRIEIIGELAEQVGLPGMDGNVDESLVEELAQIKTLRGIVSWIDDLADGTVTTTVPTEAAHAETPPAVPPGARRFVPVVVPLDSAVPSGTLADRRVAIVGSDGELYMALADEIGTRGGVLVAPDELAVADVVIDLSTVDTPDADARAAFSSLAAAALGEATTIMAVGIGAPGHRAPTGVAGLMRTLAREFPAKELHHVEIGALSDGVDTASIANELVDELLDPHAPGFISHVDGTRTTISIEAEPSAGDDGAIDSLGPDAVVVVTGGARGITARVARALAAEAHCQLVLVGRSPLPGEEDPRTSSAADRTSLRRTLLDLGELTTPAAIEAACNRILADREIRATMTAITDAGARVEYHAIDVRDDAFGKLLIEIRERHGRLDGVIHGAGVLDDHFVKDKTTESFDRVFGTKVEGARAILAVRDDTTRFVVLFGSVSGVFGNRGQCDYSAANDSLDALAGGAKGPGRVVSIDWGPWGGGGMVSPELEREYARRGIGLLDPDEAAAVVLHEVKRSSGPHQVIVMSGTPEAFAAPTGTVRSVG